ncbi:hypothetical protein [Microcoleus sp. B5-D4]
MPVPQRGNFLVEQASCLFITSYKQRVKSLFASVLIIKKTPILELYFQ